MCKVMLAVRTYFENLSVYIMFFPDRGDIPWTDAEATLQDRFAEILEELKPYM